MRLAILFLLAAAAYGQSGHWVRLNWTNNPANPAGTLTNVYRFLGPCNPLPTAWTLITPTSVGAGVSTYQDNAVVPRVYCYAVTAVYGGLESVKSAPAEASVPSFAPTGLQAAVAGNQVTLTWVDEQNPPGSTYSVYHAPGLCSGSPAFTKIATALTAKTYVHASAPVGNNCYAVTATDNGVESPQTSGQQAAIQPAPPTAVGIQAVQ